MNNLKRILLYTSKYWKQLLLSGIASTLFGIFAAAPSYLIQQAVDLIIVSKKSSLILSFMIGFVVLFLLKGLFMFISGYYMEWVGNKIINDIRKDLFSKIIYFPTSFFQKKTSGELLSHFLNDIAQIQNASGAAIRNGIRSFFEASCLIGVAFIQNWKLSLLMVSIGPALVWAIRKMGFLMRKSSSDSQKNMGLLSSFLGELFIGVREVKSFNTEETEIRRFSNSLDRYFSSMMENAKIVSLAPAFIEVMVMCGMGLVFYSALIQIIDGSLTPGQLTSFFAAILLAYQPIKRLVNVYSDIQTGLGASERVFETMDMYFDAKIDKGISLNNFDKAIQFRNVSFSYDDSTPVFSNINLDIKKGEKIAIIGQSGCGKSTLCDLLLKFLSPQEGQILIDGLDFSKISALSLRSQIGYVSQRPFLFNDRVAANIAYSKPFASEQEVTSAAQMAFAHDFITNLPQGYNTVVGENGALLSGGQKQRLTIARVLLKDPQILIFDEATSALDQRSEEMIRKSIQELPSSKTVIIISHRTSFIDKVDKVFLIKDKNIIEVPKASLKNNFGIQEVA